MHVKKLRFRKAKSLVQSHTRKGWIGQVLKLDQNVNRSFTLWLLCDLGHTIPASLFSSENTEKHGKC